MECFEEIRSKNNSGMKWDAKNVTDANGLLCQITTSSFIVAFKCAKYLFGYTSALAVMLQGTTMDVIKAYQEIQLIIDTFKDMRNKAEEKFKNCIFPDILKMGRVANIEISVPRRCGQQTLRANVHGDTPKTYWRRAVFIPYLDGIISQMRIRFCQLSSTVVRGLGLCPANLQLLSDDSVAALKSHYKDDLPCVYSFEHEIELWKRKWVGVDDPPSSIQETLEAMNEKLFPNIAMLLRILHIIPVTSAAVERSNSSLKLIKTPLRSTMTEERFNALILLHIHRDIRVDVGAVIDKFAGKHPRRMLLLHPLS
ncbi:52 kDa repressor of the inhibitor of the protein kinase-like [Gigantopelta aegis]|uniref:52 kDa repressor of the inhibitor of the protein kinase-like n=1 Tax=Gigantopelta aegis TaxID=1735272 RepID=UPI001B88C82A|nr:52 kDa repressor of the inhibitor of the protein kinase-like [Gigantopelta aegis]